MLVGCSDASAVHSASEVPFSRGFRWFPRIEKPSILNIGVCREVSSLSREGSTTRTLKESEETKRNQVSENESLRPVGRGESFSGPGSFSALGAADGRFCGAWATW